MNFCDKIDYTAYGVHRDHALAWELNNINKENFEGLRQRHLDKTYF